MNGPLIPVAPEGDTVRCKTVDFGWNREEMYIGKASCLSAKGRIVTLPASAARPSLSARGETEFPHMSTTASSPVGKGNGTGLVQQQEYHHRSHAGGNP